MNCLLIHVQCSFVFSFGFTNNDTFAQVLTILNGLPVLFLNFCLVEVMVNKT